MLSDVTFQWGDGGKLYFLDLLETNEQVTMIPTTPDTRMKGKEIMPSSVGFEVTAIRMPYPGLTMDESLQAPTSLHCSGTHY